MSKITYIVTAKVDGDIAYQEKFETTADIQDALDIIEEAVEDQLNFNEAWSNTRLSQRLRSENDE